MAMSSTSVRLSMVLLAFVTKQGDGMRGPTQAESMLETEVLRGAKIHVKNLEQNAVSVMKIFAGAQRIAP